MSRICDNCGDVIPDGVDVCPNCGREDYNELFVQDILNEMGITLEKESPSTNNISSEENFQLQLMLALENMKGSQSSLEADGITETSDPSLQESKYEENIKAEDSFAQKNITKSVFAETSAETFQVANIPVKQEKQNQHSSSASHSAPRKRRQNLSNTEYHEGRNNAALTGIIVGLIVAIVLVLGIAAFMLYQMGFFDSMSDEELLGTTERTETIVVTEEPEVSEEPVLLEEEEDTDEAAIEAGLLASMEDFEDEDVEEPVEEILVTKFELDGADEFNLYSRGETVAVNYQIEPEEALIEWISSDETVAVVDEFGTIQARRGGTCTITGIAGGFSVAVSVTCNFDVPVTVMDMNMEDITLGYEGQTTALYIDYDLTDEQVAATVWESTDPSVAEVDENGVVKAVSDGTAIITAAIGDYTANCIVRCVNVTGNRGYNNPESQYTINHEDVTLTRKGEYFQLTLTSVFGTDTPELQWLSSDTAIATVSQEGVVTAVSNGTVDITTVIGEDQFRCIVRVNLS